MAASSAYLLAQSNPALGGKWQRFIQKHKLILSWKKGSQDLLASIPGSVLGTFLGQPPGRLGKSHPAGLG